MSNGMVETAISVIPAVFALKVTERIATKGLKGGNKMAKRKRRKKKKKRR